MISNNTTPLATETFSEEIFPNKGIFKRKSDVRIISFDHASAMHLLFYHPKHDI